jgi:hypothetical protein
LEDFIFIKGKVPDGFKLDYEISLFNSNEHRLLQSNGDWLSYYIINGKKKIAVAGIHFLVSNGLASSPYRSPFGSIDASPDLNPSVLFLFLQFIESDLLKSDVKSIVIKNPPTLYNPELQSLLQVFLSNLGYQITTAEPGAILMVDRSGDDLSANWERRKIKQAHDKGLELRHEKIPELKAVYDFIHSCRVQKGYPSSMTFDDLQRTVSTFPDRFLLSGVYLKDVMVAASVCVRCNQHVLYHFYSDHNTSDKSTNPTVFLIRSLYQHCLETGIRLFDLGTSSLDGIPNFGLLNFKMGLGASPTTKFTFQKHLKE